MVFPTYGLVLLLVLSIGLCGADPETSQAGVQPAQTGSPSAQAGDKSAEVGAQPAQAEAQPAQAGAQPAQAGAQPAEGAQAQGSPQPAQGGVPPIQGGQAGAHQRHAGRTAHEIRHDHFGAAGDEHNMGFDHEAILGSHEATEEFAHLSPHEAKRRLAALLLRMDLNGDGQIAKGELTAWITSSLRKQEENYAASKLMEVDTDEDERVSWSEYLLRIYGYTIEEMKAFENDSRQEMQSFVGMVNDDKEKFRLADLDKSGQLTALEYVAFLYPHSYEYMHEHEIKKTLDDLDKNNDTMISFEEYIGKSKQTPDQMAGDKENFDTFDDNKDGKLDKKEIKEWILPDPKLIAEDEANHLIAETDADKNGILSSQEILDRHDLWVGSTATDYGDGLYSHDEL